MVARLVVQAISRPSRRW